jgi:hypothetical protein
MPDSLLVDPCEAIEAGETVRSLSKAYISNTICIGKYRLLLDKQKKYKDQILNLYQK